MNGIKDYKAFYAKVGDTTYTDRALRELVKEGLVDIALDEETGEVMVSINEAGRAAARQMTSEFSEKEEKDLNSFLDTSENFLDKLS